MSTRSRTRTNGPMERDVVKSCGVSWHEARKLLNKAKNDLGLTTAETDLQRQTVLNRVTELIRESRRQEVDSMRRETAAKDLATFKLSIDADARISHPSGYFPAMLGLLGVPQDTWNIIYTDVAEVLRPLMVEMAALLKSKTRSTSDFTLGILFSSQSISLTSANILSRANFLLNPYGVHVQLDLQTYCDARLSSSTVMVPCGVVLFNGNPDSHNSTAAMPSPSTIPVAAVAVLEEDSSAYSGDY